MRCWIGHPNPLMFPWFAHASCVRRQNAVGQGLACSADRSPSLSSLGCQSVVCPLWFTVYCHLVVIYHSQYGISSRTNSVSGLEAL